MKKIYIKSTFVVIIMVTFLLFVAGLIEAEIVEPRDCEGTEKILYLEFDGAEVFSRPGDFWLGSTSITIPAYDLSLFGWGGREVESIDYILKSLEEEYNPYNIKITTEEPTNGEYNTLYVGGNNNWFRVDSSVIGIATYDPGDRDKSNYGFAFTDELGLYHSYSGDDIRSFSTYLAGLIAHEAGHNFGLNHIDNTAGTMNPYLPLKPLRSMFVEGYIPGTEDIQKSHLALRSNLGQCAKDVIGDNSLDASIFTLPNEDIMSVQGIIYDWRDADVFSFQGKGIPVRIYISYDSIGGFFHNLYPKLAVYKQSDFSLVVEESFREGDDLSIAFTPEVGEQYLIYVQSMGDTGSDSTYGKYTLNYVLKRCGDGLCEGPSEDRITCALDCVECGDGYCDNPPEDGTNCEADCEGEEPFLPQSKIVNNEDRDVTGILTMNLQRDSGLQWFDERIIVHELVTIPANGLIKLDVGEYYRWNLRDVKVDNIGNYRVYAKFEIDNEFGVEGQVIETSWEFEVR